MLSTFLSLGPQGPCARCGLGVATVVCLRWLFVDSQPDVPWRPAGLSLSLACPCVGLKKNNNPPGEEPGVRNPLKAQDAFVANQNDDEESQNGEEPTSEVGEVPNCTPATQAKSSSSFSPEIPTKSSTATTMSRGAQTDAFKRLRRSRCHGRATQTDARDTPAPGGKNYAPISPTATAHKDRFEEASANIDKTLKKIQEDSESLSLRLLRLS